MIFFFFQFVFVDLFSSSFMCAGRLVVPDPGGVPPGASGAEGECKR